MEKTIELYDADGCDSLTATFADGRIYIKCEEPFSVDTHQIGKTAAVALTKEQAQRLADFLLAAWAEKD